MRVVLDARVIGPDFPGIGRATTGLLRGLTATEHPHEITVLHHPLHRRLLEGTRIFDDSRFVTIETDESPLSLVAQRRLPQRLELRDFDVWHAPYFVRPLFGARKTVVTAYDAIAPRARLLRWKWSVKMHASLRLADAVIAISDSTRADIERLFGVPPERIHVAPLAADEQFVPQSPGAIDALIRRHALPRRYVLYVGTNKPHKNIAALIEAWGNVLAQHDPADDVGLVIAGREDRGARSWRQQFSHVAASLRLHFLTDVDDDELPALYSGALVFVFPSLHEGFGLPPLEAMACGTPVVASNRTSIPEVVGNAGVLVEPAADGIADALRALLADERMRYEYCKRGLVQAAKFSWTKSAQRTLAVWTHVMEMA
jgi:alpha-1,3-rhamnosyl/mannosyltransferase